MPHFLKNQNLRTSHTLFFHFDDLKYTLTKEEPAESVTGLISDVGGQLGLWLGASILTLVELFYCCCVLLPKSLINRT